MTDSTAAAPFFLERRIKQRVHAPVHAWFASCAPGLEPMLKEELRALALEDVAEVAGGVAFKGKLEVGYQANLWLRSAGRVLLRIAEFRANRPEALFKQARKLSWEVLIPPDVPLRFQLSSVGSWLSHEDLVERTLRDAIRKRLDELGLPSTVADLKPESEASVHVQRVMVRLEHDRLQLSLDSSGAHLHRRGYRTASSQAPLRETLAAGILLLSGYTGELPLLDPMGGTGTFGIEAARIARRLPPGSDREFLFERWPSFRASTWAFLKRKAIEGALPAPAAPIVVRDLGASALRAATANAEAASVAADLVIERADFFRAEAPKGGVGLVVLNPPYGVRLGETEDIGPMYRKIGDRLRAVYGGWRFAIMVPVPSYVQALRLPVERSVMLSHGGLKVSVVFGVVPVPEVQ